MTLEDIYSYINTIYYFALYFFAFLGLIDTILAILIERRVRWFDNRDNQQRR